MVQGALAIDEELPEGDEGEIALQLQQASTSIFSFPEQLIDHLMEGKASSYAHRKSSLPIVAVINCLQ